MTYYRQMYDDYIGLIVLTAILIVVLFVATCALSHSNIEKYEIVWDDSNAEMLKNVAEALYPVGSIILTRSKDLSPSSIAGLESTTWELINSSGNYTLSATTDGNTVATFDDGVAEYTTAEHALTISEYPSHTHEYSVSSAYETHSHYIDNSNNALRPLKTKDGGFAGTPSTTTTSSWDESSHSHTVETEKSGNGKAHSHDVIIPYLCVCAWQRIA